MNPRTVLHSFLALVAVTTSAVGRTTAPLPVLYRLEAASGYAEGCQAPCLCPIAWSDDLFGTMVITFDHSSPNWFDDYRVEDVNWVVSLGGADHRITGSGEYRLGGPVALTQELTLDLSTDGGAPVHFDSGLVPSGSAFPTFDIAIAMNNFFCYDRVFQLSAKPVHASAIVPFGLLRSGYTLGCLPPCSCPISRFRVAGGFGLLDLGPPSDPLRSNYALVGLAWQTLPAPAPPDRCFAGFGLYSLDRGATQHRRVCDVTDGNGLSTRFDSGLVTGGLTFPMILNVDVAVNGFYCYDQVLNLRARRR